ncbi:bZIP transcription factor [Nitzschia inconspicua]|uniref:BZIP transcription factor n=1 Tax=Nitzschia inconspicua TaxID=303405 RepID=A0A9K3KZI4_9STRA|nr:bZIP transcription factor [Nitzschia inconspicua]
MAPINFTPMELNKDTANMSTSAVPALSVLLQVGSLSSMLEAAASASINCGTNVTNTSNMTMTLSSTCISFADGGSSITTSDDCSSSTTEQAKTKYQKAVATTTKTTESNRASTVEDRLKRSRERNRVHARKTRQRKKEQMQSLQTKAEQLKKEQVQLKTAINEKNTANILCALFATDKADSKSEDPRVEALLRRPTADIPDPSKLTGLQPLILPSGSTHSKKNSKVASVPSLQNEELPDDGIDYELLGKDRTKCTPAELDRIRRERNRMHAKRTRDRKRHFMEEMTDMCKSLESENILLRHHLIGLNGGVLPALQPPLPSLQQQQQLQQQSVTISPSLPPTSPTNAPTGFREIKRGKRTLDDVSVPVLQKPGPSKPKPATNLGQFGSLLQAATGASVRTYHPYSSGSDSSEDEGSKSRPMALKRQRKLSASSDEGVSASIATTAASSMTSIGV